MELSEYCVASGETEFVMCPGLLRLPVCITMKGNYGGARLKSSSCLFLVSMVMQCVGSAYCGFFTFRPCLNSSVLGLRFL